MTDLVDWCIVSASVEALPSGQQQHSNKPQVELINLQIDPNLPSLLE